MYDARSGRAPGVRNPLQQSYHHGVNNLAMMYNREGFLTERQMKRDAQERHRAELEKQIDDDRRRKADERRKLKEEDDHWNARSVGMAGMRTPPRRVNDSAQTVPQPTPAAPPRQLPQPTLLSLPTPAFAPSPHPPSNLAVPASRVDFTFHPPSLSVAGEDDPPGHALTQLLAGATAAAPPAPTGDAAATAADALTEQLLRASSRVPAAPTLPLSAAAQNPDSILRSFLGADAAWGGGGGGTPAGGGLRTSRLSLKLASTTTRTASAPTPAAPALPVPDALSPERRRDSAGGGGGHSSSDAAAVAAAAASLLSTSARPVPFLAGTDAARRRDSGDAQEAHPPQETPAEPAVEEDSGGSGSGGGGGGGELLGRINGVSRDTPLVPAREDSSEPEEELIGHSKMVRPTLGGGDVSAGSSLYDAAPQRQRLVLERRHSERRRTLHREPSHLGASAAAPTTFRPDDDGDSYAAAAAATLPTKRAQPQCYLRVAGSFLEMLTEQDVRRGGTELRVEITSSAAAASASASAEDTVAASLSSATPEYIVRGMRSSSPAFEAAKHKLFPPAAWILERSGRVYRCILQPYPAFETPCDVVVSLDLPTALVQVEAEPTSGRSAVDAAALHPCSPLEFTIKSLDSHGCV